MKIRNAVSLTTMRLPFLVGLFFTIAICAAYAEDRKPPPISDSEEKALIAKVKTTWRAQDHRLGSRQYEMSDAPSYRIRLASAAKKKRRE
jgi:hypothetical protein